VPPDNEINFLSTIPILTHKEIKYQAAYGSFAGHDGVLLFKPYSVKIIVIDRVLIRLDVDSGSG